MENLSKHVNWYPNNVLEQLKTKEPQTVAEVTPADTMPADTPAQEVPNYPVNVDDTEAEAVELNINEGNIVEE